MKMASNEAQSSKSPSGNESNEVNPQEALRKQLLSLKTRRDTIEKQIKEYQDVLKSQNIGMNEPLVDNQGFPRTDIDVYSVRTARNKIICLTNDARDVTKQIEEKLFQYHDMQKQNPINPNEEER